MVTWTVPLSTKWQWVYLASCICHSGDPDPGESPIALVEIPIGISPRGNSDPIINSFQINVHCIIINFEWMGSKLGFIRLYKIIVDEPKEKIKF